jgi:hypothetical protein
MTEADLRRFHASWRARALTVSVLGDLTQIDEAELASIGAVTVMGTGELFSY